MPSPSPSSTISSVPTAVRAGSEFSGTKHGLRSELQLPACPRVPTARSRPRHVVDQGTDGRRGDSPADREEAPRRDPPRRTGTGASTPKRDLSFRARSMPTGDTSTPSSPSRGRRARPPLVPAHRQARGRFLRWGRDAQREQAPGGEVGRPGSSTGANARNIGDPSVGDRMDSSSR